MNVVGKPLSLHGLDNRVSDGDDNRATEVESDEERAKRLSELVLPELLAAFLPRTRPDAPFQLASLLVPGKRYEANQAPEPWRTPVGELTAAGSGERPTPVGGGTTPGARPAKGVEGRLVTELETGDLGRIRLVIERTDQGLKVSLGVENATLAASAMAQRSFLEQSLRASGLQVAALVITHAGDDGTVLARRSVARPGAIDVTDEGSPTDEKLPGRARRTAKKLNITG